VTSWIVQSLLSVELERANLVRAEEEGGDFPQPLASGLLMHNEPAGRNTRQRGLSFTSYRIETQDKRIIACPCLIERHSRN
jgi:hypothetical protein